MFKELFPMAVKGAFSLLLSADEGSGLMTVMVVPKNTDGSKEVPALAMPLKLTATPDELDAGFVQALTSYSTARTSLDEQVAATNEVLEAAKAASVKNGADAVTKAGAKAAPKAAAKPAAAGTEHEDDESGDENGGTGDDGEPVVPESNEAKQPASVGGAGVPDLFGA
ncbi:PRTRC system protein E [Piscinibacter defluvii]|uniref:PRTRC system protein E n=1 Tax=Piscinibacter defluvii TaxID=1796922 RepID=UPI0021750424|nr:PRTRC system protein E [Piscinibacter defluvii]